MIISETLMQIARIPSPSASDADGMKISSADSDPTLLVLLARAALPSSSPVLGRSGRRELQLVRQRRVREDKSRGFADEGRQRLVQASVLDSSTRRRLDRQTLLPIQ
jgi:hypothetical protein